MVVVSKIVTHLNLQEAEDVMGRGRKDEMDYQSLEAWGHLIHEPPELVAGLGDEAGGGAPVL